MKYYLPSHQVLQISILVYFIPLFCHTWCISLCMLIEYVTLLPHAKLFLLPCDFFSNWNNIFALVTISEIIFALTKNNSLGLLSVSRHPFWSIWRNRYRVNINKPCQQGHRFSLTDDWIWDLSSKAMINDGSQSKVFTLRALCLRDRCWKRLQLEAICPEQIKAAVQGPLEAPSNIHWENLWSNALHNGCYRAEEAGVKEGRMPLKNQEMRLQDANCSPPRIRSDSGILTHAAASVYPSVMATRLLSTHFRHGNKTQDCHI